jgi:hypothetical protein
MAVLLHFLTGTEGRTISPRTGSLPENLKVGAKLPIQSIELSTESLFAHKRTHECSIHAGRVAGSRNTPNRHIIAEEASQSREMRQRRKSRRRRTRAPFGGRLSYCVSFMQQGKVRISCAPQIVPFPCTVPSSPSMPSYPPWGDGIRSGFFQRALWVTWRRVVL